MSSHLWESEKLRLSQILFIRVTGGKEQLCYQDILNKEYPQIFEICVKNRVRKLFSKEKPIQLKDQDRYNLKSPSIQTAFEQLKKLILYETLFSKDEVFQLVKIAINFQYDVLVRPRQKLHEILFKTKEQASVQDLFVIINGFGESRQFIQNLTQAIADLESKVILKNEFGNLTKHIEQEVYRETPIAPFLKEIALLLDFESSVTGEKQFLVRSHVLTGMLQERGLKSLLDEVNAEAKEKDHWSIDEIESALQRHFLGGGVEENEDVLTLQRSDKPSDSGEIALDEIGELDLEQYCIEESTPSTDDASHLRIAFAEEKSEATDQSQEQEELPQTDSQELFLLFDDEKDQIQIDKKKIEKQPPGPYPELKTLINPDDQKRFVKEIFSGDIHRYTEFIQNLEDSNSWKDAKTIIDAALASQKIDPYSEESVRLGDIVFSRYFHNP